MVDPVTANVSDLYSDYPYPGHGIVSSVVASMLADPVRELQRVRRRRRLGVLDAGCGTGEQTLGVKRAFPELDVVGIDFNEKSLTMAEQLAVRKGIDVTFAQRNLTEPITELGQFDVIVSVGVLHHLAEPRLGLASLRQVATPGSVLLGMVYGRHGKRDSMLLSDVLRQICGEDTTREERLEVLAKSRLAGNTSPTHYLETLVRRLRFGPSIAPLEAARRVLSSRNAAYQADTFAHAHEVVFTYVELAEVLAATGWRFEGWPRRSGIPDAPRQLFKGEAVTLVESKPLVEQAAIYEQLLRPMNLFFLASPDLDHAAPARPPPSSTT